MTPKQEAFVLEYLIDLNATQAAIRAGYSAKTADRIGPELLGKTCVREAIEAAKAKRAERTQITADKVLNELAKIGFADIRNIFDADGNLLSPASLPDDVAAAVSALELITVSKGKGEVEHVAKIKLADKRAALVDLGKHLGLFRERVELTGKDGGPVQTTVLVDPETLKAVVKELDADY